MINFYKNQLKTLQTDESVIVIKQQSTFECSYHKPERVQGIPLPERAGRVLGIDGSYSVWELFSPKVA